jgi:hypothetical protein
MVQGRTNHRVSEAGGKRSKDERALSLAWHYRADFLPWEIEIRRNENLRGKTPSGESIRVVHTLDGMTGVQANFLYIKPEFKTP